MAKSNRDRVADLLDKLKEGLGPFVLREFYATYGSIFLREVEDTLSNLSYPAGSLTDVETALRQIDTQGWLNLLWRRWNEVFKQRLGQAERNYVSELIGARNDWAHQKRAFTNDETYRIADTAARLLEAVGAAQQAQAARSLAHELLRLRFEAEQRQAQKQVDQLAAPTTAPGLRPWRQVVQPHPDVASGRYVQAEFAADLAQVVQGRADPEYGDPREFFRRTYLTEGLIDLLANGLKRLSGQGGDPVVQLQTSFGGGKTHSMLALYHLFGGTISLSDIPGGEAIAQRVGLIDEHIQANRAVIVGTAFSATEPRRYPDATTHTLWGDIAYQLGGAAAYRLVEQADLVGASPGSDTLLNLLEQHGPALLIIDELVAFARNLYNVPQRLPAGTFDAVMTFIQALTEAVRRSSNSLLLVSIPESAIEIGGEGGRAALSILANTIGRLESVWKPISATESFAIVRRRLFSDTMDYAARDAVLAAFRTMYASNSQDFPLGVAESGYAHRMKDAYPIHPELFARLYEDWSTLERFQRTRGVLRLMAAVIHRLWTDNDQSLLIMPGSLPLWSGTVRNELLRYLPENWPAIVDSDVDGPDSRPYQLDKSVPTLGQYTASRRVARAIFIGSAPSVTAQSVRGVEKVRIHLATLQPGEPLAPFDDALRRMSEQLTYLYSDSSRYWYDTRPTVNRMAQDRAQNIHPDFVYREAVERLRAVPYRRDDFGGVHVAPPSSADIPDDGRLRLIVFSPDHPHQRGLPSKAMDYARDILESRGNMPRLCRNMVIFIAPDAVNLPNWEQALREYLAWKSIEEEAEPLNLDAQQRRQVEVNRARANETVQLRLEETYCWLIVPLQKDPLKPIEYQEQRISGSESFYERAIRRLRQDEQVIVRFSADNLLAELDQYLWRDQPHLSLKQLWEYLTRYCYLPRLASYEVLLATIREGASHPNGPFGYAAGLSPDGTYQGLVFASGDPTLALDDQGLIVRAEVAKKQLEKQRPPLQTRTPATPSGAAQTTLEAPPKRKTRYHATVQIEPQRLSRDAQLIAEEVIQHLTSLVGSNVRITLEIEAEYAPGFDDRIIHVVGENSRALKFKQHGFEE